MERDQNTPFINDRAFKWRPGRLYLPAVQFTGMSVSAINEGGAANDAYGLNWESSDTSAPYSKEISTFGVNGILMMTDGMMVSTDLMAPYDLDVTKNIYARVHWTCGSTDVTDAVLWKCLYRAMVPEVTALAAAGTAFDTVIASDLVPVATAYTINRTSWAKIIGNTLSKKVEHLSFQVEMDTKAAALSEDLFFLGLELRYTPKRLYRGDGMAVEAKMPNALLGDLYT